MREGIISEKRGKEVGKKWIRERRNEKANIIKEKFSQGK